MLDISAIKDLIKLVHLNLHNNQLTTISSLMNLKSLTRLYLHNNQLSDITGLMDLNSLTIFWLQNNQLSDISVLKNLRSLIEIYLHNNLLSNISALKNLKGLKYIDLRNNQLMELPIWITDFNMGISFFDRKMEGINLYDNPIKNIPIEIVKQDKHAILKWFKQESIYGTEKVFEAKVLVVGEGGSGKTSLIKKIINKKHRIPSKDNKKEKSTLGIEIRSIKKFNYKKKNNQKIITNIWDFGGQDIQYSLHQYFISDEALYILVSDYRSEKTRFSYWFQTINTLGSKKSRVIVLLNKFKDVTSIGDVDIDSYKRDFPKLNIETVKVDLSENDKQWEDFKELTAEKLSELLIVGQDGIKIWKTIRDRIEKEKKKGMNYVSLQGFYNLAEEEGMKSDDDIHFMLDYFHKIGVVIYFEDETNLQSDVFLNPNWITRAIYDALSVKNKEYKNGQFSKDWLFDFWKEKGYKEYECNKLLPLMEANKFDICYPLPNNGDKYVVPLLLSDKTPKYNWNDKNNLQLQYDYDQFMPEGILSQFIVKTNELIAKDGNNKQLVWKSGVILERDNTKAEIREHTNGREIHIKLQGDNKTDLRGIIMFYIDSIISRFPKQPIIKIPCNCSVCKKMNIPHFFKYDNLLDRKAKGILSAGECENSYQQIKIANILEDFKVPGKDEIVEMLKDIKKDTNQILTDTEYLKKITSQLDSNQKEAIKSIISEIKQNRTSFFESEKDKKEFRNMVSEFIKNEKDEKAKKLLQEKENKNKVDVTSELEFFISLFFVKYKIKFSGKGKFPKTWKEFIALFITEV